MCEICKQNPCHSRCPNAPELEPTYKCVKCHEGIFSGDRFLELNSGKICMDCLEDMSVEVLLKIAGLELSAAD